MSDKDQFTFDDDDDFPETDLSNAFSDGEHEIEGPSGEVEDPLESFAAENEASEPVGKVKKSKKPKKQKEAGNSGSRTKGLLLVLLLVVGGAAGAYYFMDLGGTTPAVQTVAVTAKTTIAPAKPKTEPATSVKVAVPPPPPQKAPEQLVQEPVEKQAPVQQQTKSEPSEPTLGQTAENKDVVVANTEAVVPVPKPDDGKAEKAKPDAEKTAVQMTAMNNADPAAMQDEKGAAVPKQVADGRFSLDAGSYLFETNRDTLIQKIKKLGYEPLVTPVDATLDMTRLRLGTFSKEEVKEALAFARTIESGSYSAPAGDNYVIYAGTFLSQGNIEQLTRKFNDQGIKVYPEPVQVVRTLSRIRFGHFATRDDAAAAAAAASEAGVKAVVVKSKSS